MDFAEKKVIYEIAGFFMKKILIPISNSFFVRNFLRGGFLQNFDKSDVVFLCAVPKDKIDYYKSEFNSPKLNFVEIPVLESPRLEKFFREIETSSIPTRTIWMMHWFHFRRSRTQESIFIRTPVFILRVILWSLGHAYFWRGAVRLLYGMFKDSYYRKFLELHRPDAVFSPTMVYGSEWIFLREAKRLKIKTLGMTSSWDNLYAKTLLRVHPDLLFVQTKVMKKMAEWLGDLGSDKIFVTGVPQYDQYFKDFPTDSRNDFIKSLGGDPNNKFIVYAFSGKSTAELDFGLAKLLSEKIKEGKFGPVQLLIRPYPKRDFSPEKAQKISREWGVLVSPSAKKVGESKNSWEFDEGSLRLLRNTLTFADLVITACSTFIVESAVFDKPIISVGFDLEEGRNYWNSARRFFDWNHLRDLTPLNGVRVSRSLPDFYEAIELYLKDPSHDHAGRQKIVEQQCVFTDGRSVERVARVISSTFSVVV